MNMDSKEALVVFEGTKIRRTWHDDQWYFSVVDVVRVLTESADSKDYWYRLKKHESESSGIELSTFCRQLKLPSSDGKKYETDCVRILINLRCVPRSTRKKVQQTEHLEERKIQCMFKGLKSHCMGLLPCKEKR